MYGRLALVATGVVAAALHCGSGIAREPVGDWFHGESEDALTKAKWPYAITESQSNDQGALAVRCIQGRTGVLLLSTGYFPRQPHKVEHRIDSAQIRSAQWGALANSNGVLIEGPSAVDLARSLGAGGKEFVARVHRPHASSVTYVFSLHGATEAMAKVRATCRW